MYILNTRCIEIHWTFVSDAIDFTEQKDKRWYCFLRVNREVASQSVKDAGSLQLAEN